MSFRRFFIFSEVAIAPPSWLNTWCLLFLPNQNSFFKLINRRDGGKEKEIAQKYEAELDALRMKLTSQEEEFRLQQETLIAELNKVTVIENLFTFVLEQNFEYGCFRSFHKTKL